jgi:hypothetical protein
VAEAVALLAVAVVVVAVLLVFQGQRILVAVAVLETLLSVMVEAELFMSGSRSNYGRKILRTN